MDANISHSYEVTMNANKKKLRSRLYRVVYIQFYSEYIHIFIQWIVMQCLAHFNFDQFYNIGKSVGLTPSTHVLCAPMCLTIIKLFYPINRLNLIILQIFVLSKLNR